MASNIVSLCTEYVLVGMVSLLRNWEIKMSENVLYACKYLRIL